MYLLYYILATVHIKHKHVVNSTHSSILNDWLSVTVIKDCTIE